MDTDNKTKRRIRETALKLFQEKSFEDVTLNEICEKSGVNRHTFYYYFKSKDDLLEQYYSIPYQFKTADISTILTADSFVEQLWLLNRHMVDYMEKCGPTIAQQIFIKNLLEDVGTFKMPPEKSAEKREILKLQKRIVENGQAAGQFRNQSSPEYLVMLFFQLSISSAVFWIMHGGKFSFADYLRNSYECAFDVDPKYRKMQEFKLPHHFMD